MERLDKFLCDSGVGTRSQVKAILKSGRVAVDGKPERDNGRKIDPKVNTVTLDGEVRKEEKKAAARHEFVQKHGKTIRTGKRVAGAVATAALAAAALKMIARKKQ